MIQTDDLFLGAFGLVRGGEISTVEVKNGSGRPMCIFHISGSDMSGVEREYHKGVVSVDLRLLRSEVQRLKNTAFDAMRRERGR
jgi:hypothetical protein